MQQFGSIETLVNYGKELQAKYRARTREYDLIRLTAFFQQLRQFNSTFDVLIHLNPKLAAPLWGSIRLSIEVS